MTTSTYQGRRRGRRGVILILVLGVLGLMAVIGVTFATFSGQSRISSRNFAQSKVQAQGDDLMDFALSQLICDTSDVRSAIRGHSLARDMYGNDGARNGFLASRPGGSRQDPNDDPLFYITEVDPAGGGRYLLATNIIAGDPDFYGYDFTRWTIRVADNLVPTAPTTGVINQTFEVLADSGFVPGSSNYRVLTVAIKPSDSDPALRNASVFPTQFPTARQTITPAAAFIQTANQGKDLGARFQFVLDGRWLNAFNGPGKTYNAKYANFRFNADAPDSVGMDEDYDACDLENWFLAMQSADGQVVIPSFHRPANVRYQPGVVNDWENPSTDTLSQRREKLSRILRPRQADDHDPVAFPDLIPSDADGKIRYDVDNDGDGVTDSVWVDLGYPARRNAQGNLYKPLFAFMVIGLNGRIPLNTAGNLAQRDPNGSPNSSHATHLGNSVSEIDPRYGLQNDRFGSYTQYDDANVNVALTQLRNIVSGTRPHTDPMVQDPVAINGDTNYVPTVDGPVYMPNGIADGMDTTVGTAPDFYVNRLSAPVPGRWGEPEGVPGGFYAPLKLETPPTYTNEVRAGYSMSFNDVYARASVPWDTADDNSNSFDAYPRPNEVTGRRGEVRDEDLLDDAGALLLPIERMRRFVTPLDLNGTGEVGQWNSNTGRGGDYWGRVAYQGYFRPPGLPGQVDPVSTAVTMSWRNGQAYPSSTITRDNVFPPSAAPSAHNNNMLHGYESSLFPNLERRSRNSGGMLAYVNPTASPLVVGVPTRLPTYDFKINSGVDFSDADGNSSSFESRSDGLNEADELNLYNVDLNVDAPYSHSDLEWLYRKHDVDGASLSSRLGQLAPVSFLTGEALTRRRIFAIESWESNAYVWANDNPQIVAPGTPPGPGIFPDNHSFGAAENATMRNFSAAASTPSLASRGRKINLNMPLPVSNDPFEPIRQKWISEAYQLMKAVLPPRAIDTPEEKAQLGQYLVNVIDFRDTDCTMTIWDNPDVYFVASAGGAAPTLAASGTLRLRHYGMEYNPVAINEVLAYSYPRKEVKPPATGPGVDTGRFFIELVNTLSRPRTGAVTNNAGIINLGGFAAANAALTSPYDGACWDMVFTDDGATGRPDPFTGQLQPAAPLYGLTPLGRNTVTSVKDGTPTPPTALRSRKDILLWPLPRKSQGTSGPTPEAAWFGDDLYMCTLGYQFPGTLGENNSEADSPGGPSWDGLVPFTTGHASLYTLNGGYSPFNASTAPTVTVPDGVLPRNIDGTNPPAALPTLKIARDPSTAARYFWVHIRRPANPLAAVSATNPMVVVDSMRFPYIDAGATARTDAEEPANSGRVDIIQTQGKNDIFSYQRLQPYRGGQAVPVLGAAGAAIDPRYGYTEQIARPETPSRIKLWYGTVATQRSESQGDPKAQLTAGASAASNGWLYHTLGLPNDGTLSGSTVREYWDYFPFHDRDFSSLAELTLVPGCAPGLFTKQFAEFAPSQANLAGFANAAAATRTASIATSATGLALPAAATECASDQVANPFLFRGTTAPVEAHTFPYLIDKFFYTAAGVLQNADGSVLYDTANSSVDGFAADSWYKMFEFFEVPTQMTGAIGPVANGTNFDWYREDLKPGLMNLNLIIDEQAFLALLGKQDLTPAFLYQQKLLNPFPLKDPSIANLSGGVYLGGKWNGPLEAGYPSIPMVVTASNSDGSPAYVSTLANTGHVEVVPGSTDTDRMKAAYAQFLWLRHGGSGFLFGYGEGAVGQNYLAQLNTPNLNAPNPATDAMPLPRERPFRSMSYPDIDFTPMRPAALPPSTFTDPPLQEDPLAGPLVLDPGVRNRFRYPSHASASVVASAAASPILPPAIPARRLFQVPDASPTSNASLYGDAFINQTRPTTNDGALGGLNPATGALPPQKTGPGATAFGLVNDRVVDLTMPTALDVDPSNPIRLGSGTDAAGDLRQHPYFRSELMQRVVNLTTPRTHQFAVWITVGLFEVKREGDIAMIAHPTYFDAAYDILGPEIGASTGQNKRFRSFFVVDRLKLTGFDPDSVGAFRPAVVYRRTIE